MSGSVCVCVCVTVRVCLPNVLIHNQPFVFYLFIFILYCYRHRLSKNSLYFVSNLRFTHIHVHGYHLFSFRLFSLRVLPNPAEHNCIRTQRTIFLFFISVSAHPAHLFSPSFSFISWTFRVWLAIEYTLNTNTHTHTCIHAHVHTHILDQRGEFITQ